MQTAGFILHETPAPYYSCRAFESLTWLRHGFSTRRLLCAPGIENTSLISLKQIHSNKVHVVESRQAETENHEGDALVTNVKNAALAIKTADCFPVLIVDPVHRAIGAVHSGWRGTLTRVLPNAIDEMFRRFQSDPARLLFALGPGIRECCFEVGEEVARLFIEAYPEKSTARPHPTTSGKYLVNLPAVLKAQLMQSGVPPENIHDLGMCTCCNTRDFFSWRAEGPATGRMIAVIAIAG